jgi:hypothetical protein
MRVPFAWLMLMIAVSPAMAQSPLDGRWAWSPEICGNSVDGGEAVPSLFAGNEIDHYESRCTITSLTPIGTSGAAWNAAMDCTGEGEEWSRNAIFAIDRDEDGAPRLLIEIDRDEGYVVVRHWCD